MPRSIVFLCVLSAWTLAAAPTQSNALELSASQRALVSEINELRAVSGLSRFEVDTVLCYLVEHRMEKLRGEGYEADAESTLTAQMASLIRDWNKRGFIAAGDSLQEILTGYGGSKGFS